ncbi:MAG: alpha/beta fold hydrolase [Myxococcaceae bacterium]|nr:alpha/beta fold hydrolase [Myxococcaceae bacterium]
MALGATGCASWFAHPLPPEARTFRAKTDDGWELGLVQYLPEGTPTGRPVLLCHGISANGRHMDLDEAHSLARYLAAHGREAWTMSIRGTGASDRADPAKGRRQNFTFDDVWRHDTRTAIAFVRGHAETPRLLRRLQHDGVALSAEQRAIADEEFVAIDYIGHSMGGMLVYAYLAEGGEGLHAVVTLGSPTRMDWGGRLDPVVVGASRLLMKGTGRSRWRTLRCSPCCGRATRTAIRWRSSSTTRRTPRRRPGGGWWRSAPGTSRRRCGCSLRR